MDVEEAEVVDIFWVEDGDDGEISFETVVAVVVCVGLDEVWEAKWG